MQDAPQSPELKVPKWPFFLADAFMLGVAYYLFYWQTKPNVPLSQWEVVACSVCVFLAAVLGIVPYLLEYRAVLKYGALLKLIETSSLTAATEKLQNLERCVTQIGAATDHLQSAQVQADKTALLAQQITERMTEEVKGFSEFMLKASDGEKATLRLEVEKLRRSEHEWLQVLVFMLDHIFALNKAAERSGQENLIKQLAHFQNACRDAARRLGLIPVLATAGEAFDPQKHQLADGETAVSGVVGEVMASGYSYQSKLIRPVLVKLQGAAESGPASGRVAQSQLPLSAAEPAV
ncbi:MAG: nucleotide exchange factor GrpE [Verrucomicrobiota bacterium]